MALETLEGMSEEEWYELQRQMEQDAAMEGLGAGPVARDPLRAVAPIQYQKRAEEPKRPGFLGSLVKNVLPAAVGLVVGGPPGAAAGAALSKTTTPSAPPPVAPTPDPGFLAQAGESLTSRPFLGRLAAGATSAIMNRQPQQAAQAAQQVRPGQQQPTPPRRRVAGGGARRPPSGQIRTPTSAPATTAMKAGMTWPEAQAKGISREEWLRSQGPVGIFNDQAYRAV